MMNPEKDMGISPMTLNHVKGLVYEDEQLALIAENLPPELHDELYFLITRLVEEACELGEGKAVPGAQLDEEEMIKHNMGGYLVGYIHGAKDFSNSNAAQDADLYIQGVMAGLDYTKEGDE